MKAVAKIGRKSYHAGGVTYLLLLDIVVDGERWRDHAWVRFNKRWYEANLKIGYTVSFDFKFAKKFNSKTLKYDLKRLSRIRNIEIIDKRK